MSCMSDHTKTSPVKKSDIFKARNEPLSIKFITNSMIAVGLAVFFMLYIVVTTTRNSFIVPDGNERVNSMVKKAKQLEPSVNESFLATTTAALKDDKISSSEMSLIESEYEAMTDKLINPPNQKVSPTND